jgi:cold shock CspA family protein
MEGAEGPARCSGVCKSWNIKKGWGFIHPSTGGDDVFVHYTQIKESGFKSLAENEPVMYDLVLDPNTGRPQAHSVTGVNEEPLKGGSRPARKAANAPANPKPLVQEKKQRKQKKRPDGAMPGLEQAAFTQDYLTQLQYYYTAMGMGGYPYGFAGIDYTQAYADPAAYRQAVNPRAWGGEQ